MNLRCCAKPCHWCRGSPTRLALTSKDLLSYVDGPDWQAVFSRRPERLAASGHMSGLFARTCPLALMKFDDKGPYQLGELHARDDWRGVPCLRSPSCRSSR